MQESYEDKTFNQVYVLLKYLSEPKQLEEIFEFLDNHNISRDIFELCLEKNI